MRLYWLLYLTIFLALAFMFKLMIQNIRPQISPLPQEERKAVSISSIYEPDCLDTNTKICPDNGEALKLLIAVMSAPHREKEREAIRGTWGHFSMRRDISIAFFIGESTDLYLIDNLYNEEEIYGDIIMCPFVDESDVSTVKAIQILEWVNKSCSKAKFLLKTTDDVFINVSKLMELISSLDPKKEMIYGKLSRNLVPARNLYDPNFVSTEEYKYPFFPDFTIGPSYLIPVHLCEKMFWAIMRHNFLKFDDILLTGLVAESLNIRRIHIESFVNSRLEKDTCNIHRSLTLKCLEPIEQFDLWVDVNDMSLECQKHRNTSEADWKNFNVQQTSSADNLKKIYEK